VRFPASTLKALSRAVACIAGREFVVPEDVNDAASLFLPLALRSISSEVQFADILAFRSISSQEQDPDMLHM